MIVAKVYLVIKRDECLSDSRSLLVVESLLAVNKMLCLARLVVVTFSPIKICFIS